MTLATRRTTGTPRNVGALSLANVGRCGFAVSMSTLSYAKYNSYMGIYPNGGNTGTLTVRGLRTDTSRRGCFSCAIGLPIGRSIVTGFGRTAIGNDRFGRPLLRFSKTYTKYNRAPCTGLVARLFNSEVCVTGTAKYSSV